MFLICSSWHQCCWEPYILWVAKSSQNHDRHPFKNYWRKKLNWASLLSWMLMRQDTFIEAHHPDPWQFSLWLEYVLFFWQPNWHRAHVWNQINSWSYSSHWLSFLPLPHSPTLLLVLRPAGEAHSGQRAIWPCSWPGLLNPRTQWWFTVCSLSPQMTSSIPGNKLPETVTLTKGFVLKSIQVMAYWHVLFQFVLIFKITE